MRLTIAISALLLTAPLQAAARADSLDAAARDYVRLQLAIGEKEDGYIDAYYGPDQLKADGKALAARSDLPGSSAAGGGSARPDRQARRDVPPATVRAALASSARS